MILYIYGKCSTCKDAVKFLEKHKIPTQIKEITKETPSLEELRQMFDYQNKNLKKLFNTSGMLYKELEIKDKLPNMSLEESLELLNQHGMLIKRPFFLGKNFGLTGFKEAEWIQALEPV